MKGNNVGVVNFLKQVERNHGINANTLEMPPVFEFLQGEIVDFNNEEGYLKNRFPVKEEYLNPYGSMQGGMIAAVVDNTIGPLSMAVASLNFTRNLNLKYSKPVSLEHEFIYVKAFFERREGRYLKFKAIVENAEGEKLATAKADHWLIEKDDQQ